MTKDLRLEECVNMLNSGIGSAAGTTYSAVPKKTSSTSTPHAGSVGLGHSAPSSSVVVGGTLISTPGSCTSTFSAPAGSKMMRRNSKNDLRGGCKCTIRLLDDNEIMQCDFLVRNYFSNIYYSSPLLDGSIF
jgi:hypothetical protein